jgi:hypothetical protein
MENDRLIVHSNGEEAVKAQLSEAAAKSYTERFYTLMRLIKISSMISNAKVVKSPNI